MKLQAPTYGDNYTSRKGWTGGCCIEGLKFKMCFQFLWYVHWSYEAQEDHLELHIWTAHVSHKEVVTIIMF